MQTRRATLQQGAVVAGVLASAGLLPTPAQAFTRSAFEARTVADAVKAFGGGALIASDAVKLTGPEIAENGAVVPLGIASTAPAVRHLLLLVEKNPSPLVAMFNVTESVEPDFTTRAKMAQSSDVYAVAITRDGKALYARKEVKVTLGGCGG